MCVQRIAHSVRIPLFRQIHMRHLCARVHTGVRTPGPLHQHPVARKSFNRRGQDTLHRELISLYLPAAERRAVIFDGQFIAGHAFACDRPAVPVDPLNRISAEVTR